MQFDIRPSSAEPIYRQIVEQVRRQAASGSWPAGTLLPSVRALALEHAINPMTVSKAYQLLEAEGLLQRLPGMGMVIASRHGARRPVDRMALLEPALHEAARQAAQLGIGAEQALTAFARTLSAHLPKVPGPAAGPSSREGATPARRGEDHASR